VTELIRVVEHAIEVSLRVADLGLARHRTVAVDLKDPHRAAGAPTVVVEVRANRDDELAGVRVRAHERDRLSKVVGCIEWAVEVPS
jgi:hypothetical protein